ncbi:hypothetical protein A2680_00470 [Candidatus Kaiserbacteria bacterium RIFCSPHIGHO2_01_FULL_55_37]|nr:MAG: hypothetical protein A2680_00470 [Candidatus Kaiserbacteria bacterium RIFCSPHIGHO2_01_FULL_55_37]
MNDFLKMDIFFIVTTLAVIMLGIVVTLILFRVWRILGHIEEISRDISEESALLRNDVAQMRARIKSEGFKFSQVLSLFGSRIARFWGKKGK